MLFSRSGSEIARLCVLEDDNSLAMAGKRTRSGWRITFDSIEYRVHRIAYMLRTPER